MASIQDGGIRIFSVVYDGTTAATITYSQDSLESLVNTFLKGDGTADQPLKELIGSPVFWLDVTSAAKRMFVVIQYKRIN